MCVCDTRWLSHEWAMDRRYRTTRRKGAEDRLFSLRRRPAVAVKYNQVMEANLAKRYVRKLKPEDIDDGLGKYLPHEKIKRLLK